jgi:hypothetical protein
VEIVTLQQVKWDLNLTVDAHDARLTDLANQVEGEVLNYIGDATYTDLQARLAEDAGVTELPVSATAPLVAAIRYLVKARFKGEESNPRTGFAATLLVSYRVPKFSSGTTE